MRDLRRAPDWTDFSEQDLGITLLELLDFVGDALSGYQDRIAEEARLRTRRRYVVAVAALAGIACWIACSNRRR